MVMYRGEIWWVTLPQPVGSEPGYRRPVLIVQNDSFNRSLIQTVIVVIITSNLDLAEAPGNVLLPKRATGLPRDSVANVSQTITLDKSFLEQRVGFLSEELQDEVDEGLRLVMYL
ncbi:MAG: type II toxin-antitoxin system PemK/MazF family toxin [Okeania sp. SIO3B5]|uniref:type II toxin-antitoxin system PemK/MazF family toxin n=1 Tax=Okeania sp. SIO3B5 TaxID=2607811 RepID=UPI0013FFBD75|nr:type II toxin-antitoxin system PemK/MazF family toxin [Okeania sp. SIO3B5]NEO57349.1 type II toxin-antitoxin system PemK/MazF family toxin [Okeania sp. SIO3B5]